MCGRYALYSPADAIADLFGVTIESEDLAPRYNAAPMQWLPVIRRRPSGERVLHTLRWGLLPSWAKDETIAARLINARAETLAEKPAFRAAYRARRCIIPADGFYEWAKRPDGKQPYFIHVPDGAILAFAGLWERWPRPADTEVIDSFTIVTTEANHRIQRLHDRMPVILAPRVVDVWLDPATDPARLSELLIPCPEERLAIHPVSRAVGNVRNECPELIAAVADADVDSAA
ncbi:SOS response-associated peptidase [Thiocapsa roseopersicina]|uniref:Abasic site processing protein n=1 Tax=Thiocapsa roseopersicina TaxID=1058 RepID=A0A1H3CYS0_THIRO|nr:SOS response-associated peptidase [Thiocapsa roseopersicina]SDX59267.1 Putative SOS response-associated peptidase YedK [Thiocapsa roseopersicina]